MEAKDHMWVTTIQFGTKYCGFAYQGYSDYQTDPAKVMALMVDKGTSGQVVDLQFPTSVLLSKLGDVSAFGYKAQDLYRREPDGIFFSNFGESLYRSQDFDDSTVIKDFRGNTYNALEVFAKFIKALCEYSNRQIGEMSHESIVSSDIKWVLTVPSVRADKSVSFFRKGWQKASVSNEMITVVTYPDAALTYCLYLHPYMTEEGNSFQLSHCKIGERVLFIGFEGELDSFNVYEKIEDQKFQQIVHFLSGSSSRESIIQLFDNFFGDLVGTWRWQTAKQNDDDLWPKMTKTIDILMERPELENKVTFSSMFVHLNEICDEHTNMTLKQIIESSEYSSRVKFLGDKLRIDQDFIKLLFDKVFKKIIHNIKHVLWKSDDKDVQTIILVGNIAKSGLLRQTLKTEFLGKQVIVPRGAMETALKGAAVYGHKPIVVSTIFCGAQVMVSR